MAPDLVAGVPLVENLRYDTWPIAVHAPGKLPESPWWEPIKTAVFHRRPAFRIPDSLAIVTWNSGGSNPTLTVRGHTLGWFERSLALAGISPTVLGHGIGVAWTNRLKLELTLQFLATTTAEFILGADSSDVLLVGDPGLAIAELRRKRADVIFNAEKNCWPPTLPDLKRFEDQVATGPFRYLNSGLFIGTRVGLRRAFEAARAWAGRIDDWAGSDQVCWKHAYRELHPAVLVDDRCRIFQTLNGTRRELAVDGRRWPMFRFR